MNERPRYRRLFDLTLGGGRRIDAEMDQEIESHVAMRAADLVRGGMSPEDARAEALRRFGDFAGARRRLHTAARKRDAAMRHRDRAGSLLADLRYAMRQARRAPGFTALAVATLAIGIGATTTMFTLVDHILLRALPFPHAEQLVSLTGLDSAHNSVPTVASADWLDWRRARSVRTAIHGYPYRQGLVAADSALRVSAERVSGNYFQVLGARFVAGRAFTEDEVLSGASVVVISERLWRHLFGADARLATPVRTATRSYTIVGVVAEGQEFPAGTDAWFPVPFTAAMDPSRVNVNWLQIARLADGATAQQAASELTAISYGIRAADPSAIYDYGVVVTPLAEQVVGGAADYLKLLMAVVVVVLLIVCANVSAAGLARGAARSREMAIRTSLGADRWRLVQQLLIEHAWLGLVGGGAGLFLAWAALRGILARWGGQIPRAAEVSLDARIFLFALATSLTAGVLAGTIPAWRVTRTSLRQMLTAGGRTSAKGGRNLAGSSLVSAEIALALLLLTGAGLLIRSFRSVVGRGIGIDTNVATAEVTLGGALYATDTARRYAYWNALLEQFRAIPGVQAAAVANWIPLGLTGQTFVEIGGREAPGAGAIYRTVSDDFFPALRIPLLSGRSFDAQDGAATPRVVVINHKMATAYWPGENPLGKLVRATSMERAPGNQPAPWLTIVGVVGDLRTYGLETDGRAEMYVLIRQTPSWTTSMTALVRANVPANRVLAEMRRRARAVDPRLAVDVGTLDDRLRATLAPRVLTLSLLTGFSGLALLLAAIGVYGVLSYAVTQRTRELAVRAALGARRGQLLVLVMRAGLRVVITGMVVGIVAAFALTRTMSSMLVGVSSGDPLSYAGAIVVLLIVALAAIVLPAHRATRMDPVIALQAD